MEPLQSTPEGGIYICCRQNEPALTEKEMELLPSCTIGNGPSEDWNKSGQGMANNQLAEFHGMIGAQNDSGSIPDEIRQGIRHSSHEGESGQAKS